MAKTVCIIGAGIGGLTAGAYLAMKGYQVTIMEKASTVGGSAGWYVRRGRTFPTGATIAFGLEEDGILQKMLDELDIKMKVKALAHPMDVIMRDRKISIFQDPIRWKQELTNVFPERAEQVIRFWECLSRISDHVLAVTNSKAALPIRRLYDLGKLPQYLARHPISSLQLVRYARWTVEDLLRKYKLEDYVPFREMLNAQLMDAVQTDLSQAALLPSSLALNIYRRGSFAIEGGLGVLSKALAERITHLGGTLILASPVHKVHYDNSKAQWHVSSLKHNSLYDILINNAGISFGAGTSYADKKAFSWGAFRIDAVLKNEVRSVCPPLRGKELPFAFQIMPSLANSKRFGDEHGPIYVTFHDAMNQRSEIVPDEVMMTVSIHTPWQDWLSYDKSTYRKRKDEVLQAMMEEINRVLSIDSYILRSEAGTPLTYKQFIGKAEVGGFPLTVRNAILQPNSVRSSLRQLYIVGEQVFPGPGTLSGALSGYYAARSIIKEP